MEEKKHLDLMLKFEQEQKEVEAKKAEEEYVKKLNYRKDLLDQMDSSIGKREEAFEKFLKDKLWLDELIRLIHEEDMRCEF